jgi:hypothetical protein
MELLSKTRKLIDAWATAAQQQACRNAMVASTSLAKSRALRLGVEEFLASRYRPSEPVVPAPRGEMTDADDTADVSDPDDAELPAPAANG